MKQIRYSFFLLFLVLFCYSCSKELEPDIVGPKLGKSEAVIITGNTFGNVDPEFNVENGMLNFSSMESLNATLDYLNSLSPEDIIKWSEKYDINTQRVLFEKTVLEENDLNDHLSSMPEDKLMTLSEDQLHSSLYKEMISKKVIKEYMDKDGVKEYNYAVCDPVMAAVLNEKGMFSVKDDIYYLDGYSIKKWEEGDASNLGFIKTAQKTDSTKGVSILYEAPIQLRSIGSDYTPPNLAEDVSYDGTYRYILEIHFGIFQQVVNYGQRDDIGVLSYKYYVRIVSEKRTSILGTNKWSYRLVDIDYNGTTYTAVRGQEYGGLRQDVLSNTFVHNKAFTGNNAFIGLSLWSSGHHYHDHQNSLSMTINEKRATLLYLISEMKHSANLGGGTIKLNAQYKFKWDPYNIIN